jgi:hypothetical protein
VWAESGGGVVAKPKELTKEEMKTIAIKAVKETIKSKPGVMPGVNRPDIQAIASGVTSNNHQVILTMAPDSDVSQNSDALLITDIDGTKFDSSGEPIQTPKGYFLGFKLSHNPANPPQIFVHKSFEKTGVADVITVLDYEGGNGAIFTMGNEGYVCWSFPFKRVVGNKSVTYLPSEVTASVSATEDNHAVVGLLPMVDYIPADITTYYGIGTNNVTYKCVIYPLGEVVLAKENGTGSKGNVTVAMTKSGK